METKQTAAEWLETAGHQRDAEDDWRELQTALDMLRDAKAELEQAQRELNRHPTYGRPLSDEAGFRGWETIERKWREGGYK